MKVRVLIADDEALGRQRLRQLLQGESQFEIVAESACGLETLKAVRRTSPDLVFLDIKMPGMDGFGVVKALEGSRVPAVIIVTAHHDFAVKAFEVNAVDYLLKPVDRDRFQAALQRARDWLDRDRSHQDHGSLCKLAEVLKPLAKPLERLTVKVGGRIVVVKTAEIDWISAADNYVELRVAKATHLLRRTITDLATQLPQGQFVRISRSVLVNLDRILEIRPRPHGDYLILLDDGTRLNGARNYRLNLPRHRSS